MQFEWLAALAYPRAIAVHPNFASQARPTAAGRLASEILEDSVLHGENAESDPPLEGDAFADQVIGALRENSSDALVGLELSAGNPALDLGQRTCANLVLTALQLELGAARRGSLDEIVRLTGAESDSLSRLAHLWVRLAAAVIRVGYGDADRDEFRDIRGQLENWVFGNDQAFPTTEGLGLSAEEVTRRINEFLSHAALRWEISLERLGGDLWKEQVRRRTPLLLSGLQANVARGYSDWNKRTYQQVVARGTRVFGGAILPGDASMVTAVLVAQFCFHPYAQHAAMELGRARFLRARLIEDPGLREWAIHSALNLMRFSGEREPVRQALRFAVRHGPLAAITSSVDDVLTSIDTRGKPTHLEIDYLFEVAPLLTEQSAATVYALLAEEVAGRTAPLLERWTAPWARRESLTKCLAALSAPAGKASEFLLLVAERLEATDTDMDDRQWAHAVQVVPELPVAAALTLLEKISEVGGHPVLRDVLAARLGESVVGSVVPPTDDESPMDEAVRFIDQVIRKEISASRALIQRHGETVRADVMAMRRAIGVETFGGTDVLDVAVAYATVAGYQDLWPVILDVLREPRITRSQKSRALGRIANSADAVPTGVRRGLQDLFPALLASEVSPFDEQATPFGPALQVAAALELIEDNRLLVMLGPLMSSPSVEHRLAAISVWAAFPTDSRPNWVTQLILSATFDTEPDVQAEAVQALAYAYSSAGPYQAYIADRINDLLARDGSWLLRKLLSELADESASGLRAALAGRLRTLAQHPDWRVRKAVADLPV